MQTNAGISGGDNIETVALEDYQEISGDEAEHMHHTGDHPDQVLQRYVTLYISSFNIRWHCG